MESRDQYEVRLQNRTFRPTAGISSEVAERLATELRKSAGRHVYVQFLHTPDALLREELGAMGLSLLDYIGSHTWRAEMHGAKASRLLLDEESRKFAVRWLAPIPAEDKLSRYLKRKGGQGSRAADGRRYVVVRFFADINADAGQSVLTRSGAVVHSRLPIGNAFIVAASDAQVAELAADDAVAWIEPPPPPGGRESDRARALLQVDAAQASGFDGDGVKVGVFDAGHVDDAHPDFVGRVTKGDADPWDRNQHPTMTGGLIAGDGTRSTLAVGGGSPQQYRGAAPAAEIFTYDFWRNEGADWATAYADYLDDLLEAINNDEVDVGNNSWGNTDGCGFIPYGEYATLSGDLDAAVAGGREYEGPLTIVFSAGNDRDGFGAGDTSCLDEDVAPYRNYKTLNHPKSAKNILVVGAVDSVNDRMTTYSNWGPTGDGRLKPEVVATGMHGGPHVMDVSIVDNPYGVPLGASNRQFYRTPNYRDPPDDTFWYAWFAETSAAAAATSGAIAQLIDAWREKARTTLRSAAGHGTCHAGSDCSRPG